MFRTENSFNASVTEESNNEDTYETNNYNLIRLGYLSVETNMYRQLLLGFTPNNDATDGLDNGFDGEILDVLTTDAYFSLLDKKLAIQGKGQFNDNDIIPLGILSANDGFGKFTLEEVTNLDENQPIYLYDNQTGIYHDLRNENVVLPVTIGEINNRFTIRFKNESLSNDTVELETNSFYQLNNEIVILNSLIEEGINDVELFNILGQQIKIWKSKDFDTNTNRIALSTKTFAKGVYIVNVNTNKGSHSKKISIK